MTKASPADNSWPPLKKALWEVVTSEMLNEGRYINAYHLTDKLYAAALTPSHEAGTLEIFAEDDWSDLDKDLAGWFNALRCKPGEADWDAMMKIIGEAGTQEPVAYKFKLPFEIYHDKVEIGDQDGHVCTAESPEIAEALIARLNAAPASHGATREALDLVCSNKPRPSVQKGAKGNQHWKRDVHHVAGKDRRTLCGINASEWLTIGPCLPSASDDPNLCDRCKAALTPSLRGERVQAGGGQAEGLANELDQRLDAYLNSINGGQNQAVNEVALRNALWDNKAGIIAHLRSLTAEQRAIQDITAERQRQISSEGWTSIHDDQHNTGEMARAAACYALSAGPVKVSDLSLIHKLWPWEWRWFKPRSKREDLVRAGALIAAEIERLDRIGSVSPPERAKL